MRFDWGPVSLKCQYGARRILLSDLPIGPSEWPTQNAVPGAVIAAREMTARPEMLGAGHTDCNPNHYPMQRWEHCPLPHSGTLPAQRDTIFWQGPL